MCVCMGECNSVSIGLSKVLYQFMPFSRSKVTGIAVKKRQTDYFFSILLSPLMSLLVHGAVNMTSSKLYHSLTVHPVVRKMLIF